MSDPKKTETETAPKKPGELSDDDLAGVSGGAGPGGAEKPTKPDHDHNHPNT